MCAGEVILVRKVAHSRHFISARKGDSRGQQEIYPWSYLLGVIARNRHRHCETPGGVEYALAQWGIVMILFLFREGCGIFGVAKYRLDFRVTSPVAHHAGMRRPAGFLEEILDCLDQTVREAESPAIEYDPLDA